MRARKAGGDVFVKVRIKRKDCNVRLGKMISRNRRRDCGAV